MHLNLQNYHVAIKLLVLTGTRNLSLLVTWIPRSSSKWDLSQRVLVTEGGSLVTGLISKVAQWHCSQRKGPVSPGHCSVGDCVFTYSLCIFHRNKSLSLFPAEIWPPVWNWMSTSCLSAKGESWGTYPTSRCEDEMELAGATSQQAYPLLLSPSLCLPVKWPPSHSPTRDSLRSASHRYRRVFSNLRAVFGTAPVVLAHTWVFCFPTFIYCLISRAPFLQLPLQMKER